MQALSELRLVRDLQCEVVSALSQFICQFSRPWAVYVMEVVFWYVWNVQSSCLRHLNQSLVMRLVHYTFILKGINSRLISKENRVLAFVLCTLSKLVHWEHGLLVTSNKVSLAILDYSEGFILNSCCVLECLFLYTRVHPHPVSIFHPISLGLQWFAWR